MLRARQIEWRYIAQSWGQPSSQTARSYQGGRPSTFAGSGGNESFETVILYVRFDTMCSSMSKRM
jgi:hypothetical protein